MKIAIEGMDGVGKTTLANYLCKTYNLNYMSRPIKHLFNLKQGTEEYKYIDKEENKIYNCDNNVLKAWLSGMGNMYALMQEGDYVLDRTYLSNYFWAGDKETEKIFKTMIDLVGTPDITVILYASIETRMKRIANRDKKDRDLTDIDAAKFGYDKMSYFVKKFDVPYVAINTENKSIEEVIQETERLLKEKNIMLEKRKDREER